MGVSLSSSSTKKLPEPEMNVTPLVDVVLVLLIIFMVIAPSLNEGEHVELPSILQPDEKPRDMNPINVTLALNGTLVVEDERIQPGELRNKVKALHDADPERALLLKTDQAVPYRKVRDTFAMLQGIGFKGLSLKVLELKKAGAT